MKKEKLPKALRNATTGDWIEENNYFQEPDNISFPGIHNPIMDENFTLS